VSSAGFASRAPFSHCASFVSGLCCGILFCQCPFFFFTRARAPRSFLIIPLFRPREARNAREAGRLPPPFLCFFRVQPLSRADGSSLSALSAASDMWPLSFLVFSDFLRLSEGFAFRFRFALNSPCPNPLSPDCPSLQTNCFPLIFQSGLLVCDQGVQAALLFSFPLWGLSFSV